MANIKSQIKRNRQNEKRRLRNRGVRSEINTRTKVAIAASDHDDETATETLRLAVRRIDKAAAKGVIHKNNAARRKSRLVREIERRRSESADGLRLGQAAPPRRAPQRRGKGGQPGHQHLQHQLVGPVDRSPQRQVRFGQQPDGPGHLL